MIFHFRDTASAQCQSTSKHLAERGWRVDAGQSMNPLRSVAYLILVSVLPMVALAQDGWLFSVTPPIIMRYDGSASFNFTNTSESPIHGVTLHNGKEHRMIIDTIEPHKTISVALSDLWWLVAGEMTVTCVNYSKPLKVKD